MEHDFETGLESSAKNGLDKSDDPLPLESSEYFQRISRFVLGLFVSTGEAFRDRIVQLYFGIFIAIVVEQKPTQAAVAAFLQSLKAQGRIAQNVPCSVATVSRYWLRVTHFFIKVEQSYDTFRAALPPFDLEVFDLQQEGASYSEIVALKCEGISDEKSKVDMTGKVYMAHQQIDKLQRQLCRDLIARPA